MDLSIVYSKTAKGLRAGNAWFGGLSSQAKRILTLIDGKLSTGDILAQSGKLSENELETVLTQLENDGHIRILMRRSAEDLNHGHAFSSMVVEEIGPVAGIEVETLDFSAFTAEADQKEREAAEAAKKTKEEAESKTRAEAAAHAKAYASVPIINAIYILVLAGFVGFEVIGRVSPLLHTPLMSATNAISGISLVGSLVAAGSGKLGTASHVLGFIAVTAATINVVGGFMITDRMLRMFKLRGKEQHG